MLGLGHCTWTSLVAEGRGYSLAGVPGLLVAVASLAGEHGLRAWAPVILAHRLSCPMACGILVL